MSLHFCCSGSEMVHHTSSRQALGAGVQSEALGPAAPATLGPFRPK